MEETYSLPNPGARRGAAGSPLLLLARWSLGRASPFPDTRMGCRPPAQSPFPSQPRALLAFPSQHHLCGYNHKTLPQPSQDCGDEHGLLLVSAVLREGSCRTPTALPHSSPVPSKQASKDLEV